MNIKIGTCVYYKLHHWKVYSTKAIVSGDRIQFRFLLKKVGATETRDYEWVSADDVKVFSIYKKTVHIEPKEEISHTGSQAS